MNIPRYYLSLINEDNFANDPIKKLALPSEEELTIAGAMGETTKDQALVASIVRIGKSLNIPTLAEGVEDIKQKEMLESFGCEMFQGFYFAKPMKIDALKEYLV
ncbi:MAG: EAL domain-containing protein [Campylobacterota bacterium]|nr:EAL domain-containing protein [Campylobacterota bacterium]